MSERTAQSGAPGPVFEPVIFVCEGHEIRAINDGFIVWMVADDLAKLLGCPRPINLTGVIDDDDEKGLHTVWTANGPRPLITLSEYGCYQAIFRSRKPNIRDIRRWFANTVIPETLRTGKDAGMTTGGATLDVKSSARPQTTQADQAGFWYEPTGKTAGRFQQILRGLISIVRPGRQGQIPQPDHWHHQTVPDLVGGPDPGTINNRLLLQERLTLMTQHCQTMKMIQRRWHEEPVFKDPNHPRREIFDYISMNMDQSIESATRMIHLCEEALEQSKPLDPQSPSSEP